jgi:hypothetical protein
MNHTKIRSGTGYDIVFELAISGIEDHIDPGIQLAITYFPILGYLRMPRFGIGPRKVITLSRESFHPFD